MSRLSLVCRVAVAALLALLLVRGDPAPRDGEAEVLDAGTSPGELAALRAARPASPLAWRDTAPPSPAVAALLAGAAGAGVPVTLRHPSAPPRLRVEAPRAPVALRRASLGITVRGDAGDSVRVAVDDGVAPPDTVVLPVGPDGTARASLAVLPTRPGPASWTVRAGGAEARARAWVAPERPIRVRVVTGPPTWESDFAVRALEAAGARVTVRQALGRGQAVASPAEGGSSGPDVPAGARELDDVDVVVALDRSGDADLLARLGRWVAEEGGGVYLAPAPGAPAVPAGGAGGAGGVGPWSGWSGGASGEVDARDLTWGGPAEVEPLPPASLHAAARRVRAPSGAVALAWAGTGGEVVAAAAAWGRGRVVVSGLESWPWRMEAGLTAAHEAYWASLAGWLAGGLTDPWTVTADPGAPGEPWIGRLDGDAPADLALRGPGLPAEARVPVTGGTGGTGGAAFARFVPPAAGGYGLAVAGEDILPARHGVVVGAPDEPGSWAAAALAVGGAGGSVAVEEGGARPPGRPSPRERGRRAGGRFLPFLLLAALSATGWAARRLDGLA